MIDLHMHSSCSDGSLTPEELVDACAEAGVTTAALTDHDTVAGLDRFLGACERASIRGIAGVEISVDSRHGSLHLLGYFMDHHHPVLQEALAHILGERTRRNHQILINLHAAGVELDMSVVMEKASGDVVGRPHIARAMLDGGYVASIPEAFDRYLGTRGSCYVAGFRYDIARAIAMLHEAGGVAVLAHPVTLRLGVNALIEFAGELKDAGLDGIEVYYPEHNDKRVRQYLELARRLGLACAGGSDFHGESNPAITPGRGFGGLRVPDSVLSGLETKRPAAATVNRLTT